MVPSTHRRRGRCRTEYESHTGDCLIGVESGSVHHSAVGDSSWLPASLHLVSTNRHKVSMCDRRCSSGQQALRRVEAWRLLSLTCFCPLPTVRACWAFAAGSLGPRWPSLGSLRSRSLARTHGVPHTDSATHMHSTQDASCRLRPRGVKRTRADATHAPSSVRMLGTAHHNPEESDGGGCGR